MVNKLEQSNEYKTLFKKAFNERSDTIISFYRILKSISEYEKSLISLNSNFNKYLNGNESALSKK